MLYGEITTADRHPTGAAVVVDLGAIVEIQCTATGQADITVVVQDLFSEEPVVG